MTPQFMPSQLSPLPSAVAMDFIHASHSVYTALNSELPELQGKLPASLYGNRIDTWSGAKRFMDRDITVKSQMERDLDFEEQKIEQDLTQIAVEKVVKASRSHAGAILLGGYAGTLGALLSGMTDPVWAMATSTCFAGIAYAATVPHSLRHLSREKFDAYLLAASAIAIGGPAILTSEPGWGNIILPSLLTIGATLLLPLLAAPIEYFMAKKNLTKRRGEILNELPKLSESLKATRETLAQAESLIADPESFLGRHPELSEEYNRFIESRNKSLFMVRDIAGRLTQIADGERAADELCQLQKNLAELTRAMGPLFPTGTADQLQGGGDSAR